MVVIYEGRKRKRKERQDVTKTPGISAERQHTVPARNEWKTKGKRKKKTAINVSKKTRRTFPVMPSPQAHTLFASAWPFASQAGRQTHSPSPCYFLPRLIDLDFQPLLAVCYRLLPLGESGILAGHAAAESALELGSEGEFADLLALVAAHDIALLLETGVLHAFEARAPGFDVGGFGVVGERAAAAG
jgi:hypothetical protein